jgi:hypothetical protein
MQPLYFRIPGLNAIAGPKTRFGEWKPCLGMIGLLARHGNESSWVDLELDLWRALTATIQSWRGIARHE